MASSAETKNHEPALKKSKSASWTQEHDVAPAKVDEAWMRAALIDIMDKELNVKFPEFDDTDSWLPTPHGLTMARSLHFHDALKSAFAGKDVLELGSGVGNHTVPILRQKPKSLTVTEISESRLDVTRSTLKLNGLSDMGTRYVVADWLAVPAHHQKDGSPSDGKYDVVVTNPPFAKSGKCNRRYYIDELILNSHKVLRPNGLLIFIQSSMADLPKSVRRLQENGYDVQVPDQRSFPWRSYYYDDPTFLQEASAVPDAFKVEKGHDDQGHERRIETLYMIKARLKPWTPPSFAHLP